MKQWLEYAFLGLFVVVIIVSAWNVRMIRVLQAQMRGVLIQQAPLDSDVFMDTYAWGIGQVTPSVLVLTERGTVRLFADVVKVHNIIFIAWDQCLPCLFHFPKLNQMANYVQSIGGSFSVVGLFDDVTDAGRPAS